MRFRPLGLLLSGVVVLSTGCASDATAPSSLAAHRNQSVTVTSDASGALVVSSTDAFAGATAASYTVTIDPTVKNVLHFGAHTLVIPARSVCVGGSGYGFGTWDDDCRTAREAVTITADVRETSAGIPRIDFYPAMRFSPKQAVMLLLYVPNLTPESSVGEILYCATESSLVCVNEAAIDPVLATYRDYDKSSVYRRIKHFSGYFLAD